MKSVLGRLRAILLSFTILPTLGITGTLHGANLAGLIESAQKNSEVLAAWESKLESQKNEYSYERLSVLPQISAVPAFRYTDSAQYGIGIELQMDFQKIFGNFPRQGFLQLKKDEFLRFLAKESLRRDVTQIYLSIYVLKTQQKVYTQAQAYFKSHLNDIAALVSRGLDLSFDQARCRLQLGMIASQKKAIENDLENAVAQLNSLTKLSLSAKELEFTNLEPDGEHIYSFDGFKKFSSKEELEKELSARMKKTALWKIEEVDRDLARNLYEQSKYYFIPSLIAGVEGDGFQNKQAWDDAIQFYVALSIPLSGFYTESQKMQKRKNELKAQKNLLAEYERVFRLKVKQLTKSIESSYVLYKDAKLNLAKAKRALELAGVQYRRGRIKEIDILDTYSQYLVSQENLWKILKNFYTYNLQLSFMVKEYNAEEQK